ncbi:MAG: helix-turn-helix domain-containing protein [Clostridia bacterium]|nr:helix-turn-helix domain-containing protein [Clostridia bacterium]
MDIELKFSETLNDLLIEHNLNARTLAKVLGMENSTITRYLNGERLPTIDSLVRIADYFKCSTDYLLCMEDESYQRDFSPCPPFAERLAFLLNYYKCSSYRVYHTTGISQGRFYDWKNGISVPTVDNVVKLAKHFNCSVDFIIGRSKI